MEYLDSESYTSEGYTMLGYKQTYAQSCGAAALLCAAGEFGLIETRGQTGRTNEKNIYTSIVKPKKNTDPNTWGISKPSDIVCVAREMGMNAQVVVYKTWSAAIQKFFFPTEMSKLRGLNAYTKMSATHSNHILNRGERELKIMAQRSLRYGMAMHYVMVRPDGSVMDPGDGKNDYNIKVIKDYYKAHGIGVSIILSRDTSA